MIKVKGRHDDFHALNTQLRDCIVAMSKYATSPDAIIIGAGPAGIAMAYQLKYQLNFHDFIVYEKLDGVGGTWRTNSYPGW
jgi:cation diffusion facilitator CzcD-associated flavoprotein CzcO